MKHLLSALALGLLAQTASAQDAAQSWGGAPSLNPYATDWTGTYAGFHAAAGNASSRYEGAAYDVGDYRGAGVHVGAWQDYGHLALGGELSYARIQSFNEDARPNGLLQLKARLGRDTGSFMPYLTAGAARITEDEIREGGVLFGLGVAVDTGRGVIVGLEYTRNHFPDVLQEDVGRGLDLNVDLVQFSAGFRF